MATALYLASASDLRRPTNAVPPVILDSDGYYWFLYRYFESANLERHKGELIDLYGGGVIEGYQLHRLQCELEQALEDVERKPQSWTVLVGWKGDTVSLETEEWQAVERNKMIDLVSALLALVGATSDSLKLVCDGD
jgi:hypothetical protein